MVDALPEQTCHGVAADVVQWRVVVVLLSVRCVRVQAVPELRVSFVQLPGQGLVATCQGLAELGGRVAHGFDLALPPAAPSSSFDAAHTLAQHGFGFFFPGRQKKKSTGRTEEK